MRVARALTWPRRAPDRTDVSRIPHRGKLALVTPQRTREHAVILLDLVVDAHVTDERARVIDRNAVPLVHLGLRRICIVSEWIVLVEDLANAANEVDTRTDGCDKIAVVHLRRIVDRAVPPVLRVSGIGPRDAVGIVRNGRRPRPGKGSPVRLFRRILYHACACTPDEYEQT